MNKKIFLLSAVLVFALMVSGCSSVITSTITPVGQIVSYEYSTSIRLVTIIELSNGDTVIVKNARTPVIGEEMEILETTDGHRCIQPLGYGKDYWNISCWNIY